MAGTAALALLCALTPAAIESGEQYAITVALHHPRLSCCRSRAPLPGSSQTLESGSRTMLPPGS